MKAQDEYTYKEQVVQDARTAEQIDADLREARAKRKEDPELKARGEYKYSETDPVQEAKQQV